MSTISTPCGDRPPLNVGGRPGRRGRFRPRGAQCGPSVFESKIAPWQSPTDRNHPLPEWPPFQPAHLSACFHLSRLSGCWPSTAFTWRQNITKATARISHQPIWPGEISRASVCAVDTGMACRRDGIIPPEIEIMTIHKEANATRAACNQQAREEERINVLLFRRAV